MAKITQLDDHLSNMIAAGEVVERPSGIVKELIENCIDAQATHIEIQIVQGGIEKICIIDDGIGMDFDDVKMAFERHATSKIRAVDDLWNIHTMGFRGEALPSIASVSQVTLRSNDTKEGSEIIIHYGKLQSHRPCGTPKGTMIEIKNLFQKTPARFKHLKSPQYEFSLIADIVQKFACSHPEIGFELSHDGRTVFKTKGNGNLREVIMQIYGRAEAKSAITLTGNDLDYEINGLILQPKYNRATRYYLLLYINNRMIKDYHLQKAVFDAYSQYLPKDRYPIGIINIKMDAQLVDVNVHPSKWEIRLSKEKQLEQLLYHCVKEALRNEHEIVNVQIKKPVEKVKIETPTLDFAYSREPKVIQLHEEVNDSFINIPETVATIPLEQAKNDQPQIEEADVEYKVEENVIQPLKKQVTSNEAVVEEEVKEAIFKQHQPQATINIHPSFPQLRVIGQFHNSYILAEGEKGLYIIDQHAAQERYHYEVIRKQILSGVKDTQPLLIPLTLEVNAAVVARVAEMNTLLAQLGIHFEVFGSTTLLCREIPIWLKDTKEEAFLQDMIDLWQRDGTIQIEQLRDHAIATMACHSSIRFHRSLTMDEMKKVIKDLEICEQPFHCPHGRPTFVCYEDQRLIHDFERG